MRNAAWPDVPAMQKLTGLCRRVSTMADFGPPGSIRAATRDQVVYLTGTVDAGLAKHLAESVAMQTPGVTRIVSSIAVENQ
jgi:hypothetical protein